MSMTQKRKAPVYQPSADAPEDGELAVLDRDDANDEPDYRRRRVERRDWRGEGVVGTYHTD